MATELKINGKLGLQVMEILKTFQEKGHTIVVITHNRDIAAHCADRIISMEKGRIVSDIPTGAI